MNYAEKPPGFEHKMQLGPMPYETQAIFLGGRRQRSYSPVAYAPWVRHGPEMQRKAELDRAERELKRIIAEDERELLIRKALAALDAPVPTGFERFIVVPRVTVADADRVDAVFRAALRDVGVFKDYAVLRFFRPVTPYLLAMKKRLAKDGWWSPLVFDEQVGVRGVCSPRLSDSGHPDGRQPHEPCVLVLVNASCPLPDMRETVAHEVRHAAQIIVHGAGMDAPEVAQRCEAEALAYGQSWRS